MFRSTLETVLYSYLTGFVLAPLTVMPEGILMVSCLALALSAQLFKRRIFWTTSSYFMLVCGLGALMFHVFHLLSTFVIGDSPMSHPQVIDWIIEALLTPLAAPLLFPLFRWFDKITEREQTSEISAQAA
jgi:cell shape-determining protein MreD